MTSHFTNSIKLHWLTIGLNVLLFLYAAFNIVEINGVESGGIHPVHIGLIIVIHIKCSDWVTVILIQFVSCGICGERGEHTCILAVILSL